MISSSQTTGQLLPVLLGLFLLTPLHAQKPDEARMWTGSNGATFRGTYSRSLAQGGKIEFLTAAGKVVTVAFGNLSEKDQELIRKLEGNFVEEKALVDLEAFKEFPLADRSPIPELKAKDFGGTDDGSAVDALWISMLWWEALNVVPIPIDGNIERKAGWLHKELMGDLPKGGRSTSGRVDAASSVGDYFRKHLNDIGGCKITRTGKGINPTYLANITVGNTIVILQMTMKYEDRTSVSSCAALERVGPDEAVVLHMFGKRLTGKLIEANANQPKDGREKYYELVLTDRQKIPAFHRDQGAKFFLNVSGWDGVLVLEPYIYKTPGKPAPIPE